MAATCSVEVHERAHSIFPRIRNLSTSTEPRRLSAIWESYILGILQPSYRITLQDCETFPGRWPTASIAMMRKAINSHPFNLSDEEVNLARGRTLLFLLGNRTTEPDTQSTPWWPQDAASFVEAVKKEREEIDTYGYIKGEKQGEAAQTAGAGAWEKEKHVDTSAPPTLKRKRSMSEGSARFARLHNSVFSNQRQPLSPIWESFIFAVAQPLCQINLRASKESSGQPDATKRITLLQKIADFHPFNFSDSEVNTSRGKLVFSVLEQILARHPRSLTWWPSDAESFVEAVKKEREEVGTYGYVGGAKQDERAESSAEDKKSRDSWSSTKVERKISDSASLANG